MPRYTISARAKSNDVPVLDFLAEHFGAIALKEIDSVFGFVDRCTLYGGRAYKGPELTPVDLRQLYGAGIGLRMPMTNHYADADEYERAKWVLEKHHLKGNAVICTNDDLARWIRRDFPNYRIEASVIKNLKSYDRISAALDLYDTVVLPMHLNEDEEFLAGVPMKERITLFANAGCALTCPSHICYVSFSKFNKTGAGELACSQPIKARDIRGMLDFDLERLQSLGFSRFKVLRERKSGMTGF